MPRSSVEKEHILIREFLQLWWTARRAGLTAGDAVDAQHYARRRDREGPLAWEGPPTRCPRSERAQALRQAATAFRRRPDSA